MSSRSSRWVPAPLLAALVVLAAPAAAQPTAQPTAQPDFGVELELRAREVTPRTVAERSFADYRRMLEPVVRALGGDPAAIRQVSFSKPQANGQARQLMRAEWTDAQGRVWRVEPEWVTGGGRQQVDFELVTPKLRDPRELERIVSAVREAGIAREGLQSSVHVHVDAAGLIGPKGDATALINLIELHETLEPQLRRLFSPARGAGIFNADASTGPEGAWTNRFARPLYQDHPELLRELAALPPGERTKERLEALFHARDAAEGKLVGGELSTKGWKYRSLNLANVLALNPNLPSTKTTVEFRMNDLDLQDPATHALQVELYRALVRKAQDLAKRGQVVPAPARGEAPAGTDPALAFTSEDPAQAAEMLRRTLRDLGLDPAPYEGLIAKNVRGPPALDAETFASRLRAAKLPGDARFEAGSEGGAGEAGLKGALDALRRGGPRPEVVVRVPVDANQLGAALETARGLAARATAALTLREAAHAGTQQALPGKTSVEAEAGANAVVFRIASGSLPVTELEQLARLLSSGVREGVVLRGSPAGLPAGEGTLVEAAARYAREAEGRELARPVLQALAQLEATGGAQLLLPTLRWEGEPYLSAATQRDLRFRAERYLSQVIALAEGGKPAAEAAVEARGLVRTWARQTGLADLLFRSLLPNRVGAPTLDERLARYRRQDGTLRWPELLRDNALREAGGAAHFALALFLKEVAVVAATGDRARIEEFFEGLATTDFYKQYGLFVAGARVGEVAYVRYLQRFVKPRFVGGLLKTNLVLAAGMALPLIVEGKFQGKAFAISLGSLGLSSAAVKAGVAGISWVLDLKRARQLGTLARFGLEGSRLARVGGWFYSAAELAVVLYFADVIEREVDAWLDLRAARAELSAAGVAFLAQVNEKDATPESVRAASDAYHQAWIAYRDFLYGPLQADELLLSQRLEKVAREAKLQADQREAALDRLRKYPALARNIVARYGSLDAYAAALVKDDEAAIEARVKTQLQSYEATRATHLREVYEANRRDGALLTGLDDSDWLLRGGVAGAAGDPYGSRGDIFAGWGRSRAAGALADALGGASKNRLQAYEDEAALLARLAALARQDGRSAVAAELEAARARVGRLADADRALVRNDGTIDTRTRTGASERIGAVGR
ncbi:MAG: amidoligase family protein [Planctomycetota bacterium]